MSSYFRKLLIPDVCNNETRQWGVQKESGGLLTLATYLPVATRELKVDMNASLHFTRSLLTLISEMEGGQSVVWPCRMGVYKTRWVEDINTCSYLNMQSTSLLLLLGCAFAVYAQVHVISIPPIRPLCEPEGPQVHLFRTRMWSTNQKWVMLVHEINQQMKKLMCSVDVSTLSQFVSNN